MAEVADVLGGTQLVYLTGKLQDRLPLRAKSALSDPILDPSPQAEVTELETA